MNNDLISREALIKALNEAQVEFDEYYKGLGKAKVITDNAPAVDTYTIEDIQEVRENSLILGAKLAQRPQGEWIYDELINNKWGTYIYYDCPFCKARFGKTSNFCPNCGAKMKGGAE